MKQYGLLLIQLGLAAPLVSAAGLVVDDFDKYTQESYVQDQMWSLWRRFGTATTDGIYSIADGAEGRGASYGVNWAQGDAGYVRHTFASPKSFTFGTRVSVDLSVTAAVQGTQVCVLIANGDPTKPGTTTYRTPPGVFLTNLTYKKYVFGLVEGELRRVSGSASAREVLGNAANLTLMFSNVTKEGAQNIHFDNLVVYPADADVATP